MLVEELGLEPGVQLRELEQAILRQDPALDLPAVLPPVEERRKTVTVLFCELAPAEDGLDPERLRLRTVRALAEARSVIEQHGGSVETRAGDELLGVFGIPAAHEDDALRAVRAAAELRRRPPGAARRRRHRRGAGRSRLRQRRGRGTREAAPARRGARRGVARRGNAPRCGDAVAVEPGAGAARLLAVDEGARRDPPRARHAARRAQAGAGSAAAGIRGGARRGPLPPGDGRRRGRDRQDAARARARRRASATRRPCSSAAASPTARAPRGCRLRRCSSRRANGWKRSWPALHLPARSSSPRAASSSGSPASGRSCSSSTTCTGPSRRCSTSSSTSPRTRRVRSLPLPRAPRAARGASGAGRRARSSSGRLPTSRPRSSPPAPSRSCGRSVVETAGGNPLFLEQLVAYASEAGSSTPCRRRSRR